MRASRTLGPISAPLPPSWGVGSYSFQERCNGLELLPGHVTAAEAESDRTDHAVVRFEHHHVPGELGAMLIAIGQGPAQTVLFIRPQNDPDRPPGTEVQLFHDA